MVVGDGGNTLGSDTVATDFAGNVSYEYIIPGPPYVTGTYLVDVLGSDIVLASTSFDDAAQVTKAFANGNPSNTFIFTVGDVISSDGTVDPGTFGRIVINDGSGTNRFTSSCVAAATFNAGPPTYTFQASDPVSTTDTGGSNHIGQYAYIVRQFTTLANCTNGTPIASSKTLNFSFAKATAYSSSALTTQQSSFAAGATAFVQIAGMPPGANNFATTWILPLSATACQNTAGGDRPDSDANGILPDSGGRYLSYPPGEATRGTCSPTTTAAVPVPPSRAQMRAPGSSPSWAPQTCSPR